MTYQNDAGQLDTRKIPLTQGYVAVVDTEDFADLNRWKWQADVVRGGYIHATRTITTRSSSGHRKNKKIRMHRQLLGILTQPDVDGDHRNGDTLNNTRGNLRAVSRSQNLMNSKTPRDNTSGRKGVSWAKSCEKWVAYINRGGRRTIIGYYTDFADAAAAREAAEEELYGEYARRVS